MSAVLVTSIRCLQAEKENLRAENYRLRDALEQLEAVLTETIRAHDDYVATNPDAVDNPDWLDDEINDARTREEPMVDEMSEPVAADIEALRAENDRLRKELDDLKLTFEDKTDSNVRRVWKAMTDMALRQRDEAKAENDRLREALAGWQLVPIRPTVAMLKAAADEKNRIRRAHEDEAIGGDYWRAMLAAAPTNAALAKEAGQSPADKWEEEIQ